MAGVKKFLQQVLSTIDGPLNFSFFWFNSKEWGRLFQWRVFLDDLFSTYNMQGVFVSRIFSILPPFPIFYFATIGRSENGLPMGLTMRTDREWAAVHCANTHYFLNTPQLKFFSGQPLYHNKFVCFRLIKIHQTLVG